MCKGQQFITEYFFGFLFLPPGLEISVICFMYKYKEKFVILQAIGIILIKSKETRVVAYTCRFSIGQLIPIFQSVAVAELGN